METQVARRRMNILAGHIAAAAHEDIPATATHLLPMSCSNHLNSVIQRRDNKMYFARQGASSQPCFMRQTTGEPGICSQSIMPSNPTTISMNTSLYTSEPPTFSRPTREGQNLQNVGAEAPMFSRRTMLGSEPPTFSRPTREGQNLQNVGAEAPMFSRPTMLGSGLQNVGENEPLLKNPKRPLPVPKEPCYAKPWRTNFDSAPEGFGWSPKMDVAESGSTYVITTELPGVSVRSIRVAVSDQILMVSGTRLIQWCSPFSEYHKKEILQGPYKVIWPLPTNADKDNVSAEFVDGFLQIVVPKLSAVKKPIKNSYY